MIIVTGTKRSGSSLWMQIMVEGGIPYIGNPFPDIWAEAIKDSNPKGFYEFIPLRNGINWATNPGIMKRYLSHQESKGHAVKVFIPGLVKTDMAFIECVIATVRHWKVYEKSIEKMYTIEEDWWRKNPPKGKTIEYVDAELIKQRGTVPHAITWFIENMELISNFNMRKYPISMKSYEKLLEEPEKTIQGAFKLIGNGDVKKALKAIDGDLYRSKIIDNYSDYLQPKEVGLFDDLYYSIHEKSMISQSLYKDLLILYKDIKERYPSSKYGPK